jgi:hypothetical protein
MLFILTVFVFIALNLITLFASMDLSVLLFFDTLVVLTASFVLMGKSFKKNTGMFLIFNVGMLLYLGQPLSTWIGAILSLQNVISIVVVLQLFSILIDVGKCYTEVGY